MNAVPALGAPPQSTIARRREFVIGKVRQAIRESRLPRTRHLLLRIGSTISSDGIPAARTPWEPGLIAGLSDAGIDLTHVALMLSWPTDGLCWNAAR